MCKLALVLKVDSTIAQVSEQAHNRLRDQAWFGHVAECVLGPGDNSCHSKAAQMPNDQHCPSHLSCLFGIAVGFPSTQLWLSSAHHARSWIDSLLPKIGLPAVRHTVTSVTSPINTTNKCDLSEFQAINLMAELCNNLVLCHTILKFKPRQVPLVVLSMSTVAVCL